MDRDAVTEGIAAGYVNGAFYASPHASSADDPGAAIAAAIEKATATIQLGIYSLTLPAVAAALISAKGAGVSVRIVCDATEAATATSKIPQLVAAGLDVRGWGSSYRLMHDKLLVVDGATAKALVALGSFNYTTQAEDSNIEDLWVMWGVQVERAAAPFYAAQIEAAYAAGAPLAT